MKGFIMLIILAIVVLTVTILFFLMTYLIKQSQKPSGKLGIWLMKIWNRAYLPMVSWSLNFVTVLEPEKILDVGMGNGSSTNLLLKCFPESIIYGIDPAVTAVHQAKNNFVEPKLIFEEQRIEATTFQSEYFDLIVVFQTHFHWADLSQGLLEVKRILKNDGEIIIACEQAKVKYFLSELADKQKFQGYLQDLGLTLNQTAEQQSWICYRISKKG